MCCCSCLAQSRGSLASVSSSEGVAGVDDAPEAASAARDCRAGRHDDSSRQSRLNAVRVKQAIRARQEAYESLEGRHPCVLPTVTVERMQYAARRRRQHMTFYASQRETLAPHPKLEHASCDAADLHIPGLSRAAQVQLSGRVRSLGYPVPPAVVRANPLIADLANQLTSADIRDILNRDTKRRSRPRRPVEMTVDANHRARDNKRRRRREAEAYLAPYPVNSSDTGSSTSLASSDRAASAISSASSSISLPETAKQEKSVPRTAGTPESKAATPQPAKPRKSHFREHLDEVLDGPPLQPTAGSMVNYPRNSIADNGVANPGRHGLTSAARPMTSFSQPTVRRDSREIARDSPTSPPRALSVPRLPPPLLSRPPSPPQRLSPLHVTDDFHDDKTSSTGAQLTVSTPLGEGNLLDVVYETEEEEDEEELMKQAKKRAVLQSMVERMKGKAMDRSRGDSRPYRADLETLARLEDEGGGRGD